MLAIATLCGCATQPRHPGTRSLRSGDLFIEVMDPNAPDRYNRGARYTPVAAVLRARYKGVEYLFNPIAHDPIDDHAGLAAEFDLVTPDSPDEWMPPGYREAGTGDGFVKIGVGVLRKQARRYSLFERSEVLTRAPTTVEWGADSAAFVQSCEGAGGYAYELTARVKCTDDTIAIAWTLTNTGAKAFTTRHYSHNFFRIADLDVGPGYVLRFPYRPEVAGVQEEQALERDSIVFNRRIPKWVNLEVTPPPGYSGDNTLTLVQTYVRRSITCTTSLPNFRTAVHARAGYVSPEQFVELRLAPSQSAAWQRTYRFGHDVPAERSGP
jgi:hypothetical protein